MFLHPIVIVVVVFLFFFSKELVSYWVYFFECNLSTAYYVRQRAISIFVDKRDILDIFVLLIDGIQHFLFCNTFYKSCNNNCLCTIVLALFIYSIRLGGYRSNQASLVRGVFRKGWRFRQSGHIAYVLFWFRVVYIICCSSFHTFLHFVHKPVSLWS